MPGVGGDGYKAISLADVTVVFGDMPLIPNEHDAAAGFTETLTAVAVRRFPDQGQPGEPPWIDFGSAGIAWPYDLDRWLGSLSDWEGGNINYLVYVVPEADYRPLYTYGIPLVSELDAFEFLATKEDVAKVRRSASSEASRRASSKTGGEQPPPGQAND